VFKTAIWGETARGAGVVKCRVSSMATLMEVYAMRSYAHKDEGFIADWRWPISDWCLVIGPIGNRQSAIENWQCQNSLSIACRTHALWLVFRNRAAVRFDGLCTRAPSSWVKFAAQPSGRAREFTPTCCVTQIVEQ
jgi:hypothetical protein